MTCHGRIGECLWSGLAAGRTAIAERAEILCQLAIEERAVRLIVSNPYLCAN